MNYIQKSLLHKISYLLLTLIPLLFAIFFVTAYLPWISSSLFLMFFETKIATGTATITTITSVVNRHMHMQAFWDNFTQNFTGTRFGSAGGCSVLDVTSWIGASLLVPVKGPISLMQHFDGCFESIILGTSVDSFVLWRDAEVLTWWNYIWPAIRKKIPNIVMLPNCRSGSENRNGSEVFNASKFLNG